MVLDLHTLRDSAFMANDSCNNKTFLLENIHSKILCIRFAYNTNINTCYLVYFECCKCKMRIYSYSFYTILFFNLMEKNRSKLSNQKPSFLCFLKKSKTIPYTTLYILDFQSIKNDVFYKIGTVFCK